MGNGGLIGLIVGLVIFISALVTIFAWLGLTPHNFGSIGGILSQFSPPPINAIYIQSASLKVSYIQDSAFGGYIQQRGPITCPTAAIPLGTVFECSFNISDTTPSIFPNRTVYGFYVQPSYNFSIEKVSPADNFKSNKGDNTNVTVYIIPTNVPYTGSITIGMEAH